MRTVVIVSALLAGAVQAGSSSLIVIAAPGECPVAAAVTRRADFVACPVSLTSDRKEPEERFRDIQSAAKMIVSAAEQDQAIRVHTGPVSLSAGRQSSCSISKFSLGYDSRSSAGFHILVPVRDGKPDVFAGSLAIRRFLSEVKLPSKVRYDLGQIQLAVDNPEQYRSDILKAIARNIEQARQLLGQDAVTLVTGLAGPVVACQVDDENVQLFMNYSFSLSAGRQQ